METGRRKTCTKCKKEQPIENFRSNKRSRDKLDYWCNQCNIDKNNKWLKNTEKGKASQQRGIEKAKKIRQDDPTISNLTCKKWYAKNKKTKIANQKEYSKKRLKENIQVRLRDTYRRRIKSAIIKTTGKKKTTSTSILLGCSVQELRNHLEQQFTEGMTWDNYGCGIGKWSIDHIKPCAKFDLTNLEEQMVCFHYNNLQPLWFEENSAKGAKYTEKKIKKVIFSLEII